VLLGYNFHLLFGSHCANALHSAGRRFKQTDVRSIVDSSLLPLLGAENLERRRQSVARRGSESLSTTVAAFDSRFVSTWCFKDKYVAVCMY
jgi:hypothetical protein